MNIYDDWYAYEDEIENTFSTYFSESNVTKNSITTDVGISDMDATIKSGIQQCKQHLILEETDVSWQGRAALIKTGKWKQYKENRKRYIHLHLDSSKWLRYREIGECEKYQYEEYLWRVENGLCHRI